MMAVGALVVMATGCATLGGRAECSQHGGAQWRVVETPHFRVSTNLSSEPAQHAGQELERFRRALLLPFGGDFDPPGQVEVILLRSRAELQEFTGRDDYTGFFTRQGSQALMVAVGTSGILDAGAMPGLLKHELGHYLLAYAFPRQPRWFAEGMAQYLETVYPKGDGSNEVVVGRPLLPALGYVRARGHRMLSELWGWDRTEPHKDSLYSYYASSWLWVYTLMNEQPDGFVRFMTGLANGEDPGRAFERALPGFDEAAFNPVLRHYAAQNAFPVERPVLQPAPVRVTEAALSDAEAHAIRSRLFLMLGPQREAARKAAERELALAHTVTANDPAAVVWASRMEEDPVKQRQMLEDLVARHPDSGVAWQRLGEVLYAAKAEPQVLQRALERAATLLPDSASSLNSLAWFHVTAGRFQEALAPAQRAAHLAPWSPEVLDTYAAALGGLGQCADAVRLQQQALAVLPEGVSAETRSEYFSRLGKLQRECPSKATAAPTP